MAEKKVKRILVSQPEPTTESSPYFDLAKGQKVKIDFRPFIHIVSVEAAEFRRTRVNLANYTAVILTSRNAVDNYFRIAEETRFHVPNSMKYFCISEAIAYYLQRYILYRKRRIYYGKTHFEHLMPTIKKHKKERFLLPSSDILKPNIPDLLEKSKISYTRSVLYKTVCSDLSDLSDVHYDILVFFSPSGIKSLLENFPNFEQSDTRIAAFGPTTWKAVEEAGLTLDIKAPRKDTPSMTMALEQYIRKVNTGK